MIRLTVRKPPRMRLSSREEPPAGLILSIPSPIRNALSTSQHNLSPAVTLAYAVDEGNPLTQFVKTVPAWHVPLVQESLLARLLTGSPRAVARRERLTYFFFLFTSHCSPFTRSLRPNVRPPRMPHGSPRAFYDGRPPRAEELRL
jgi:hypothetical protein